MSTSGSFNADDARRVVASSGVTDGAGQVTFSFIPPFATVPDVTNAVETGSADTTECRITALSTSSVTFTARRSPRRHRAGCQCAVRIGPARRRDRSRHGH
jgi:hypothetical protein